MFGKFNDVMYEPGQRNVHVWNISPARKKNLQPVHSTEAYASQAGIVKKLQAVQRAVERYMLEIKRRGS